MPARKSFIVLDYGGMLSALGAGIAQRIEGDSSESGLSPRAQP